MRLPAEGHSSRVVGVAFGPGLEPWSVDDSGRRLRWDRSTGEAEEVDDPAAWPAGGMQIADDGADVEPPERFRFDLGQGEALSPDEEALILDEDGRLWRLRNGEREPLFELGAYPLAASRLPSEGPPIHLAVATPGAISSLSIPALSIPAQAGLSPRHRRLEVGDHTLAIAAVAEGILRLDGRGRTWSWSVGWESGDGEGASTPSPERLGDRTFEHAVVAAFDPSGRFVLTGGDDGLVKLAPVREGRPTEGEPSEGEQGPGLRVFGAPVLAVAASPDGRLVAVGRGPGVKGPGSLELREQRTGRLLGRRHFEDWPPACLEFSADGTRLGLWNVYQQVRHVPIEITILETAASPALGLPVEGPPTAGPARCKEPDGRRFAVRLLKQVESDEVVIEDRRTGLFLPLDTAGPKDGGWALVRHVPHRTLVDHLLGRIPLVGVDGESALVIGHARPRWPLLPLVLLAVLGTAGLAWLRGRRRVG